MATVPDTTIVVPCYNEATRLSTEAFRSFVQAQPQVRFVFVNDGSTDGTAALLTGLAASDPTHFQHLDQARNQGKAEAVRVGMRHAFSLGGRYAGYWDADLATPLTEIPRFVQALDSHPEREICFGARVQLLGRTIDRRPLRHYLGRVFATVASSMLQLAIYDTQCGAKLFRVSPALAELFATPFVVSWTFDVELIARLRQARLRDGGPGPAEVIYELPLDQWHDVAGSKVRPGDFLKALLEMFHIHRKYLGKSL
ncbi:MAG TPA: glycosyltransferase [Polyangiales bacterium]